MLNYLFFRKEWDSDPARVKIGLQYRENFRGKLALARTDRGGSFVGYRTSANGFCQNCVRTAELNANDIPDTHECHSNWGTV